MGKKLLKWIAALLLLLAVVAMILLLWLRSSGLPTRDGEHRLPGLDSEVTVRWDRWGVPAAGADSETDLIAAQGWLHANDRMTQMEIGRRAAAGRLAEIFGEAALDTDIYFRTLRIEQAIRAMDRQLSPRSRSWLVAYARGVNAWLADRGGDLPPGLRLLGVEPEPWTPDDSLAFVMLMARDLSFWNDRPEEERFRWLGAFGAGAVRELLGDPELHVAPEIAELAVAMAAGAAGEPPGVGAAAASPGSNNWAVAPERSASGAALLAGDPHLGLNLPSIWYQVTLRSPTFEGAGMSLPGVPGVVIGRGPHVAWSLTNVMLDDHDLFFERLDEAGERYRRGETWQPIEVRQEVIRLRGGEERHVEFRATDIGPLLAADSDRGLPPRSLVWTPFFGGDPIGALAELAGIRTPEEVAAAVEGYVCPAQNLVLAFDSGELLYTMIGRVPDRRRGDGRLPSPGWVADYGWDGLRPAASNPRLDTAAAGFLATANSEIRPPGYGLDLPADFYTPFRRQRIAERLADRRDWDLAGMIALQADVGSLYADRLVSSLERGTYSGDAARAAAALGAWDRQQTVRGPAALFALFERELRQSVFSDEAKAAGLRRFDDAGTTVRLMEGAMVDLWFDDVGTAKVEGRQEMVERALAAAWRQGVERWGLEVGEWDYGSLHQLTLTHALDPVPLYGGWARRGPFALPGSGSAINAFGGPWRGSIQQIAHGPSMRWIVDWSQPDKFFAGLPGGQAGHPADRHYSDRLDSFLAGEPQEFGWTEAEIEVRTVARMRLVSGS